VALNKFINEAYALLENVDEEKKHTIKKKKTITEQKWVNIEDYMSEEGYVESFDLQEEVEDIDECDSAHQYSPAYKNKINERIDAYRKMCDLDESVEITEEHINKHNRQLKKLCLQKGGTPEEVKEQLLKGYYK